MMKNGRITMQTSTTLESLFEDFLMSKKVEGAVEKTITTYVQQFRAVSKHLPNNLTINSLTKKHLEKMIESMRSSNLSANSIRSYCTRFFCPVLCHN